MSEHAMPAPPSPAPPVRDTGCAVYGSQARGSSDAYAAYYAGMDKSMQQKVALTTAFFPVHGVLADLGCGSGAGSYDLASLHAGLHVIGVDVAAESVAYAAGRYQRPNLEYRLGDIAEPIFPAASLDGVLCSSVWHHLTSFNGLALTQVQRCLVHQTAALRPGGVLIVRDFVIPRGPSEVLLDVPDQDGTSEPAGARDDAVSGLSTAALLERFAATWRSSQNPDRPLPLGRLGAVRPGWRRYRLTHRAAAEFVLHKDYRQHWAAECLEEYTFYGATRQKTESFQPLVCAARVRKIPAWRQPSRTYTRSLDTRRIRRSCYDESRGQDAVGDIVRRGKVWYVRYKDVDGTRRMRVSHQPTRELARRYLLEVEGRIARALVGIPEPTPAAPTVAALTERFLGDYRRPQIKDLARYRLRARTCLRRALGTLGELRCDALTPRDVARLRDDLARRCAPGSAALTMTYLKTLFAWALRERIIAKNPILGLEIPRRQDAVEYLSQAEVRTLLDAADRQAAAGDAPRRMLRACVHFAVRTGLRKGELFGLRWHDVDLDTGRLDVLRSYQTTPKSGKPRHLRLPADVLPILREWHSECPRTSEALIFPRRTKAGVWGMPRGTTFMAGLPELMAAAGLRPLGRAWHTLRHTFASHYIMAGGNILILQRILGHTDIKHTLAYAHLAPDFLGAEMSRIKF